MARIALDHVDKTYPNGYVAAHDLSLEIADGELLVLVSGTLRWSFRTTRSTRI